MEESEVVRGYDRHSYYSPDDRARAGLLRECFKFDYYISDEPSPVPGKVGVIWRNNTGELSVTARFILETCERNNSVPGFPEVKELVQLASKPHVSVVFVDEMLVALAREICTHKRRELGERAWKIIRARK